MSIKLVKWYVNTSKWKPNKDQWLKLMSAILPEERERIDRFVYTEDSKTALVGRALIRRYLSKVLNVPSSELELERNSKGRPQLCEKYKKSIDVPKIFDFNISHSGDYCILCGLYGNTDRFKTITIGADLTQVVEKNSHELDRFLYLMSKREFLPAEWAIVEKAGSDKLKCINFTRLWCLKESYIKSIGLGLSFKLDRICFDCKPAYREESFPINKISCDTIVKLDGTVARDWKFIETALDEKHLVSIALNFIESNGPGTPIGDVLRFFENAQSLFKEITINDLVGDLVAGDLREQEHWIKFTNKSSKHKRQ